MTSDEEFNQAVEKMNAAWAIVFEIRKQLDVVEEAARNASLPVRKIIRENSQWERRCKADGLCYSAALGSSHVYQSEKGFHE